MEEAAKQLFKFGRLKTSLMALAGWKVIAVIFLVI